MKHYLADHYSLLLNEMTKLSQIKNSIPPRIRQLGSWGSDSEKIAISLCRRLQDVPNAYIYPQENLENLKTFASTRNGIVASIIPKIVLCCEVCGSYDGRNKNFSEITNDLRYLVERFAVLWRISDMTHKLAPENRIITGEQFIDFSDVARRYGAGTRFNWKDNFHKKFQDMPADTKYAHAQEEFTVSMESVNVLNNIDKAAKRLPGLRQFYDFSCEFVHPNVGDSIATSLSLRVLKNSDGSHLRIRKIELDFPPKDMSLIGVSGDHLLISNDLRPDSPPNFRRVRW